MKIIKLQNLAVLASDIVRIQVSPTSSTIVLVYLKGDAKPKFVSFQNADLAKEYFDTMCDDWKQSIENTKK
jgi:hypothetical protein